MERVEEYKKLEGVADRLSAWAEEELRLFGTKHTYEENEAHKNRSKNYTVLENEVRDVMESMKEVKYSPDECGEFLYDHGTPIAICTQKRGVEHSHDIPAQDALDGGLARPYKRF